jgi:uncharacterized protein (DUF433 family)
MNDEELLQRIVCDPKVMAGKPVIRGTRLTVECILNLLAHGMTEEGIRAEYPLLKKPGSSRRLRRFHRLRPKIGKAFSILPTICEIGVIGG